MKTMIVLDSWLAKTMSVSTLAVLCLAVLTPFAFPRGMRLGVDVRVDSLKTRRLENVSANAKA